MGLFGDIANAVLGGSSLAYEIAKDQSLTGAEREANEFSRQMAQQQMRFQAHETELARDWQEKMYTQYQSPSAMMRQYSESGLNPALMYGGASGGSIPSTSSPSGVSASSVAPKGGNVVDAYIRLSKLAAEIDNVNADTTQKRTLTEQTKVSTEYESKSMENRLSLLEKQLREYDTRDRLNISSIRLNDVSTDKVITETNKAIVEMATEKLKQDNIDITNQKLAEEILLIQVEKGLKILDKELRGKQITSQELSNVRQSWENRFKDEVGYSPDQPIWNAMASFLGSTSMHISDVIENIVSWFNKRK